MNKIYFNPATQYENTGDLLIMTSLLNQIRKHGDLIIDDFNKPKWFIESLRKDEDILLSEISKDNFFLTLIKNKLLNKREAKNTTQYLLLAPGHVSKKSNNGLLTAFKFSIKLWILNLIGIKIIRTGFSIGPFSKAHAILESWNSKQHHYYAIRDKSSLELATRLKFKDPKLSPDLAWAFTPVKEYLTKQNSNEYIVLSFRSNSYGSTHDSNYILPIAEKVAEILLSDEFRNVEIVIAYQVLYDKEPSHQLYKELSNKGLKVRLLDRKLLIDDAVKLYSGAKFVLSNRLHVLLLAFQANTIAFPFIKKTDNNKIISIYNDNNLNYLIIDTNDNLNSIKEILARNISKRDIVYTHLTDVILKNKNDIESNISNIFYQTTE